MMGVAVEGLFFRSSCQPNTSFLLERRFHSLKLPISTVIAALGCDSGLRSWIRGRTIRRVWSWIGCRVGCWVWSWTWGRWRGLYRLACWSACWRACWCGSCWWGCCGITSIAPISILANFIRTTNPILVTLVFIATYPTVSFITAFTSASVRADKIRAYGIGRTVVIAWRIAFIQILTSSTKPRRREVPIFANAHTIRAANLVVAASVTRIYSWGRGWSRGWSRTRIIEGACQSITNKIRSGTFATILPIALFLAISPTVTDI
mmetsp:Transcript_26570/g.39299  ORF Transcript_26570/g.39299 Transcript_26570/m.39299 type:complete len:263 (-) Transcript_26570:486-1274(-)